MKSNCISPSAIGKATRSARMDTRAKIIEKVRAGGPPAQFLPGPAFTWAFIAEDNSTNNVEVTYKSQDAQDLDKLIKDQTDEISLPTTATTSHDSRDESILEADIQALDNDEEDSKDQHSVLTEHNVSALAEIVTNINEADIHALNNDEEDSKAQHSVLTEHDVSALANIVTNINDPGVGLAEDKHADASVNAGMSKKKKVSFDDNNSINFFEDEQSEAYSPPKRRLFNCSGGADLDLIEDLSITLRQIFSPFKNAEIVVPEKNKKAIKKKMREKILYYVGNNESDVSDESSYMDHSEISSRKLDASGRKRDDKVRVGSPEFKKMMSSRRLV